MKFAIATAISAMTMASVPAAASGWNNISGSDNSKPSRISATSEGGLSTVLVCTTEGKVTAAFSTNEVDIESALRSVPSVSKNRTGNLLVGDADPYKVKLVHWSSRDLLITRKHKEGAKVFNGIVRNEPITINLSNGRKYNYALPKADATFSNFAKACSAKRSD